MATPDAPAEVVAESLSQLLQQLHLCAGRLGRLADTPVADADADAVAWRETAEKETERGHVLLDYIHDVLDQQRHLLRRHTAANWKASVADVAASGSDDGDEHADEHGDGDEDERAAAAHRRVLVGRLESALRPVEAAFAAASAHVARRRRQLNAAAADNSSGGSRSGSDAGETVGDGAQFDGDPQLMALETLDADADADAQRGADLVQLERDVAELGEIYGELGRHTVAQGVALERVEATAASAAAVAAEGRAALSTAARIRTYALPVVGLAVGGLVGGPLGAMAGAKGAMALGACAGVGAGVGAATARAAAQAYRSLVSRRAPSPSEDADE